MDVVSSGLKMEEKLSGEIQGTIKTGGACVCVCVCVCESDCLSQGQCLLEKIIFYESLWLYFFSSTCKSLNGVCVCVCGKLVSDSVMMINASQDM